MKILNNQLFNVKTYEENDQGDKRRYRGTIVKTEVVQQPGNNSYYKLTIRYDSDFKNASFKLDRDEIQKFHQYLWAGTGIIIITQRIDGKWRIIKIKETIDIKDRSECLDQFLFFEV